MSLQNAYHYFSKTGSSRCSLLPEPKYKLAIDASKSFTSEIFKEIKTVGHSLAINKMMAQDRKKNCYVKNSIHR